MTPANPKHETDSRFPSGNWVGFFIDKRIPGKHWMELRLTFMQGQMTGEGRDWVGNFTINGIYEVSDGSCQFIKQYLGKHAVSYRGYNEGRGIWGSWKVTFAGVTCTGGFHIWPEGMPDPTQPVIKEEAEIPDEIDILEPEQVPELLPVGGSV